MVTSKKLTSLEHAPTSDRIAPGIYKIVNMTENLSLDYIAVNDDKSTTIVSHAHDTSNQMWDVAFLGNGYSIRNVTTGLYLSVQTGIGHLDAIIGSRYPVAWAIEAAKGEEEDKTYNIKWPGTRFTFDLEEYAHSGTKVHLCEQFDHLEYQKWTFQRWEVDG